MVILRKYFCKQQNLFFLLSNLSSFDDLCHVMRRLGENLTKAEVKEMMRVADRDLDGKINFAEFIEMVRYI